MKIRFFVLFVFLFSNIVYSQKTDSRILKIRKHFSQINNQKTYSVIRLENQDFVDIQTDGGAVAKSYFLDSMLYKISINIGVSMQEYRVDYYFWKDSLFFVYARIMQYTMNSDGSVDYNKKKNVYEGRFYYDKNLLIKKIEKGRNNGGFNSDTLLNNAKKLQLYSYVYFWHRNLYKKMQGTWISETDNKSMIKIKDIVEDQYYDGDYLGSSRLLISNGYLYSIGIKDGERAKYKIDSISNNKISLLYLPVGRIIKYKKVESKK
jgi:hypothetical protein